MRVLIVEDNETFAGILADHLQRAGFDSDVALCAKAAREAVESVKYAAVILDLGLPDADGLSFLRLLRDAGHAMPVLITTARNSLDDKVRGLREGADDYLAKPFSADELIARLQALLRRPGVLLKDVLKAGDVALALDNRQVNVAGRVLPMRLRETVLLEILMRHHGAVVPRRYLEAQLFGMEGEQETNTVDVYIHRLRRQLQEAGATVQIHTIRGVGYMIAALPQVVGVG
ncbi:DNA-binding response regulator, OmpR family, contains REC and winged-helix (wHTH) domain [Enhydrobacter aerosaccus]|uniref:DNA-binding response regulator, OmpR family, contains REC and winged-helix (WHTH) domain n=1 Tax=Enhydrobacter aerosaccus TaxID=225324 RepID=A0A1T4P1Y0_9HYPH|nr:response regulator transcription factor [Enhydrobacter aerosaccus]SJZ85534.1 DNA-binding response regulator, OmpR family, contains REC and winged-helix (wHTH) domain [Enhydrobacter aerosaccus]